tara:strand:- start:1191 stop:1922 length:732 start_codon:yes stop_codon:yes gene_type:complete
MVGMPPNMSQQINAQEAKIQTVIQAIAQGQDISNFDPQDISAAKQYSVKKANELNAMINSAQTPPNVTREMLRNDLQMYEGFASKIAEDDPMYAGMMDAAFIGAGLYAGAKYGPMAVAKMKTMGQQGFGFAQQGVENIRNRASSAGAAIGGLGSRAAQGASTVAGYATGAAQGAAGLAGAGVRGARDFTRGITDNLGANRLGSAPGMTGYNRPYAAGQQTFGFGKNVMGTLGKLGRRLLRIPV